MNVTNREERLLEEIHEWERHYFTYEASDFERTYDKWLQMSLEQLGEKKQEKLLSSIDNILFHLHALIQNTRYHEEARNRLILQAQVFNEEIYTIDDLKKLSIEQVNFIASQQVAKQRLLAFGQGGISGMGGMLLLGIDIPALLVINLRAIQLIGLSYGYDTKKPFEMMIALKLFHAASLPKELQGQAWGELWSELEQREYDGLFYNGSEEIINSSWMQQPIRQLLKAMAITFLKKKVIQGIPLLGMAFGATMNYQFSRQITEVATRFYQKRHLYEKLH